MQGYKVVSKGFTTQTLMSATDYGWSIEYKVGEWAYPPDNGGPLCVFSDIQVARAFAIQEGIHSHRHLQVYLCEYEPSVDERIYVRWEAISKVSYRWLNELPKSTVLATSVKLLEVCFE